MYQSISKDLRTVLGGLPSNPYKPICIRKPLCRNWSTSSPVGPPGELNLSHHKSFPLTILELMRYLRDKNVKSSQSSYTENKEGKAICMYVCRYIFVVMLSLFFFIVLILNGLATRTDIHIDTLFSLSCFFPERLLGHRWTVWNLCCSSWQF